MRQNVKRATFDEVLELMATGFLRGGSGFLKSGGEMLKVGGSVNREVRVGVTQVCIACVNEFRAGQFTEDFHNSLRENLMSGFFKKKLTNEWINSDSRFYCIHVRKVNSLFSFLFLLRWGGWVLDPRALYILDK